MIEKQKMYDTPILILAGGFGTRLKPLVSDLPKPMAPVGEKPFLEYIIRSIVSQGFKNIVLLTGYKSEKIEEYFLNGKELSCNIRYSHEKSPLGTGGAPKQAIRDLSLNDFFLINGDTIAELCLKDIYLKEKNVIALKQIDDISRYGEVKVDKNEKVMLFKEKKDVIQPGLINAGVYYLQSNIFDQHNKSFISLEEDILPSLVKDNALIGKNITKTFLDIGIPDDYLKAEKILLSLSSN